MSNLVKNVPQDLEIRYKAEVYEFIEELLNKEFKDVPALQFMLALLGFTSGKKVPLDEVDGNKIHNFSIRTMYNRNESDFDAYIGLLSILDNADSPHDEVINSIAFERTGVNNTPFLKMGNVKCYFEYMLGGIDVFSSKFFIYDKKNVDIVDSIHEFLMEDHDRTEELIREMLLEEARLDE